MTTVVCFAWGPGIRGSPNETATYLRRIHAGLCRYATVPWRMVLFHDAANDALPVPDGVERRLFDLPEWAGCLPKLYAHSAEAGLKGRVLIIDLDTIICGDMDPMLSWRGAFISRADEYSVREGNPFSGGNMISFEAGTTEYLWRAYVDDPATFKARTNSWERKTIQVYVPEQTFWQVEFPGAMAHILRDLKADRKDADTRGASVIIATGSLRPHNAFENAVSCAWHDLDACLEIRLDASATHRKDTNQLMPLREPGLLRALAAAGVNLSETGKADATLLHATGREEGRMYPGVLPDGPGPYIVLEKVDGAQVQAGHVAWLDDPRVIGWVKGYAMREPGPYPAAGGRRHIAELAPDLAGTATFPDNVETWYGFERYSRMRDFATRAPDWDRARSADVSFVGRCTYDQRIPGARALERHREACIAAIRALPPRLSVDARDKRGKQEQPPETDYMDLCYETRVMVSPWGYGEPCIRDYEALCAGAVLVKPRSRWYRGIIDIDEYVIWCRPDWEDLPCAVAKAMELSRDRDYLRAARERVLLCWDDTVLAQMLAGRLWRIARRAGIVATGRPQAPATGGATPAPGIAPRIILRHPAGLAALRDLIYALETAPRPEKETARADLAALESVGLYEHPQSRSHVRRAGDK